MREKNYPTESQIQFLDPTSQKLPKQYYSQLFILTECSVRSTAGTNNLTSWHSHPNCQTHLFLLAAYMAPYIHLCNRRFSHSHRESGCISTPLGRPAVTKVYLLK